MVVGILQLIELLRKQVVHGVLSEDGHHARECLEDVLDQSRRISVLSGNVVPDPRDVVNGRVRGHIQPRSGRDCALWRISSESAELDRRSCTALYPFEVSPREIAGVGRRRETHLDVLVQSRPILENYHVISGEMQVEIVLRAGRCRRVAVRSHHGQAGMQGRHWCIGVAADAPVREWCGILVHASHSRRKPL